MVVGKAASAANDLSDDQVWLRCTYTSGLSPAGGSLGVTGSHEKFREASVIYFRTTLREYAAL
jgi:hypothetical protein